MANMIHYTHMRYLEDSIHKEGGIGKVIHPKYDKQLAYALAHQITLVCSKLINHVLNHGVFLLPLKFFGFENAF